MKKDKSSTLALPGTGFWTGKRDGIAVCHRCGTMLLLSGRCAKCHPKLADDQETGVIRNGTSYNPNIVEKNQSPMALTMCNTLLKCAGLLWLALAIWILIN